MTTSRTRTKTDQPVKLDDIAGQLAALTLIKAKQAELKEAREEIEQAIKDRLGEAEQGAVAGVVVATYKHIKRTALDQAALKAEQPNVHAEYMVTTEHRRLEVTG